jgi:DNA-binding HxlR family transcriptional regulator
MANRGALMDVFRRAKIFLDFEIYFLAAPEGSMSKDLTLYFYICRVRGMKMRKSPQTTCVLAEFLQDEKAWRYGYDISRSTGLKSGTLYPILMRLADHGLLETSWETVENGRPPRHLYKLTHDGLRYAREQVSLNSARVVSEPAFGGVTG